MKLPGEDHEAGVCGLLNQSLHGTRDAAQNWNVSYTQFMADVGFTTGKASPCAFYHKGREIRVIVHGSDFTCLGWDQQLDWFREKIKERFEAKYRGRIGPGDKEGKEMRILNRIVTWTDEGIRYEGDQRHVEIGLEELGLMEGSRSVSTPG